MKKFEIGKIYTLDIRTDVYFSNSVKFTNEHGNLFIYIGKSNQRNVTYGLNYSVFLDVKYNRLIEPMIHDLNKFKRKYSKIIL